MQTASTASLPVLGSVDDLAATVARGGVVVLDCSARWCGPCRTFAPVFAAAAARRPELTWATIDTDDAPELAVALDVRAQPTLVVIKDGAVVFKQAGALSPSALEKVIARFA